MIVVDSHWLFARSFEKRVK